MQPLARCRQIQSRWETIPNKGVSPATFQVSTVFARVLATRKGGKRAIVTSAIPTPIKKSKDESLALSRVESIYRRGFFLSFRTTKRSIKL